MERNSERGQWIVGTSFIDSDGDGEDNLSEYRAGTDPDVSDAPAVSLPPDDGDPRLVLGSVNSTPGDWNTPPQNIYQVAQTSYEAINARILAMDGTNGPFTAQTPVATLGAWVEAQCGNWQSVAGDDLYPTVSGGRFYQTVTDNFHWAGKENIFPLALHAYDGSEGFINHLVQASPTDPAGLALLSDGSPVLVNIDNPWTDEKLQACLEHLITVECRLQRVSGGGFDPSDTTAMAQAQMEKTSNHKFYPLVPVDRFWSPVNFYKAVWQYDFGIMKWFEVGGSYWFARNEQFTFLDNLQAHGFGPTEHRGYVIIPPQEGWHAISGGYETYTYLTNMPPRIFPGAVSETFIRSDGESAWFMADDTNYTDITFRQRGNPSNSRNYTLTHKRGFFPSTYTVLSTLCPPSPSAATLIMDINRDGTISSNDWNCVDKVHPYRFWVNEDGNHAAYPEANLEDFFPAQIMRPEGDGSANLSFKLSSNVAMDYIPTSMTTNNTDAYLTELDVAGSLHEHIQPLAIGSQTPETFTESAVVLLAPSGMNTNAEIYVHILESGSEIEVCTNHFSFSSITDMYRTKNLRAGGVSTTNTPSNWPDELTNGKDFVFVHGYNVTESAGHDWNSTIFKRLWHSGSNARFNGVLWDGTPGTKTWFDLGPYHYHNSVINAFATAPKFVTYLEGLNEPVVAAHSLGNMLVSEAISGDHGLVAYTVKQYYALDAAVSLEAYGDSAPDESMTADNRFDRMNAGVLSGFIPFLSDLNEYDWEDYPFIAWASEWYRLFKNTPNDARYGLTWRNRFGDIQKKTDVFNFYSSTEDVLRIDTNYVSLVSATTHQYSWQIQEHFKGRLNSNWITGIYDSLGGAASDYCGWGFVDQEPTEHITGLGHLEFYPVRPRHLHEKMADENKDQAQEFEKLKRDPLFRPTPAELFSEGAEAFVRGTVASRGGSLDYNTSNATYPIGNVPIRDWLLAKAFPARTRPMGSRNNTKWPLTTANFDMSTTYMTDPSAWPNEDNNHNKEWRHNDFKKVPYVHVYKLFEKIITEED